MRGARLLALVLVGLAFPVGLGLAVYVASGSSLAPPAVSSRVPTGEIARPSVPPTTTTGDTTTDDTTTDGTTTNGTTTGETTTDETSTDETTTDEDSDSSGRGRGRGRGRSGDD
jgi:hypothetical protein